MTQKFNLINFFIVILSTEQGVSATETRIGTGRKRIGRTERATTVTERCHTRFSAQS
jgi:hypothetical protein